jgi:hypothetical protein
MGVVAESLEQRVLDVYRGAHGVMLAHHKTDDKASS